MPYTFTASNSSGGSSTATAERQMLGGEILSFDDTAGGRGLNAPAGANIADLTLTAPIYYSPTLDVVPSGINRAGGYAESFLALEGGDLQDFRFIAEPGGTGQVTVFYYNAPAGTN